MAATETDLSCYCGAVTLRIAGAARRSSINCHCGQCRRLSGAAFTTWVTVRREHVQISDHDMVSSFQVTPNVLRSFCTRCGTHVYTEDSRMPNALGLPAGLFPDHELHQPKADYFASDKATWYAIHPDSTCFGGPTGKEPLPTAPSQ